MAYISNYQYYLNNGTTPTDQNHGSYQYISLLDIVNNFMLIYVGDDKIVDNVQEYLVKFHAKAAIKLLNFDSLRSVRALETTIGDDLKLIMPSDYVDYVRISCALQTSGASAFSSEQVLELYCKHGRPS